MKTEQKLRTQRILGELIKSGQANGEIATASNHGGGIQATLNAPQTRKNIPELGITHHQSSTFQQIADIPEEVSHTGIPAHTEFLSSLTGKNGISYVNPEVIGQYTAFYDRLSDGTQVLRKEKYVPTKQPISSLRDIWINDSPLTHSIFIAELIRNGIAIQDTENDRLILPYQAVFFITLFELLIDNEVVEDPGTSEHKLHALKGTFCIPRVDKPRSLRGRSDIKGPSGRKYREKKQEYLELLTSIFKNFLPHYSRQTP